MDKSASKSEKKLILSWVREDMFSRGVMGKLWMDVKFEKSALFVVFCGNCKSLLDELDVI